MSVESWTWQFRTSVEGTPLKFHFFGHRMMETCSSKEFFTLVFTGTWQTCVTQFLDIVDENSLHLVTRHSERVLLIWLERSLTKRIRDLVLRWRWQLPFLVWGGIVSESRLCVVEGPIATTLLLRVELRLYLVGNLPIQVPVVGESLRLGERIQLLRR